MPRLGAVAVGEGDADSLSVQRREVYAYRVPVAPQHIVFSLLPVRQVARHEQPMVTIAYAVAEGVCDVEFELGLIGSHVAGVFVHQGIAQHHEVIIVGVDMQGVGDSLLLRTVSPIAQPH